MWAGAAPGYIIGGYITTNIGALTTIRISAALFSLNLLYAIFVIPETISFSSNNEERHDTEERNRLSFLRRVGNSVGLVFAPLMHLKPTRNEETGRMNPRLLLFAIGVFLYSVGSHYLGQIIILYGSNTLSFDAKDVSRSLTLVPGIFMLNRLLLFFL